MKNFNWVFFAGMALLGLLVLVFPKFWINLVVFVIGLGSIAYGIYNLVYTRRIFQDSMYETTILVKSIFSIVVGIISVFLPLFVADIMIRSMIYVLIVYLLLAAIIGFYSVTLLKNTEIDRKQYILENLCLVFVAVLLILVSPEKLGIFIVRVIGFAALVFGLFMLSVQFLFNKNVIDAEVVAVEESEASDTADSSEPTGDGE
ncbi:MAG: hypothetical protein IJR80_08345 [Treponema sp.]|nr:hypothetical protein [Treponema sp.]